MWNGQQVNKMGIITILWEKWVEFRRDFYKITLAAMIAPLMYLLVFGLGIQTVSHGEPYLHYLIPGVISLTTMNGSFNAIADYCRGYQRALCNGHYFTVGISNPYRPYF